jgi:hypothetical protein
MRLRPNVVSNGAYGDGVSPPSSSPGSPRIYQLDAIRMPADAGPIDSRDSLTWRCRLSAMSLITKTRVT